MTTANYVKLQDRLPERIPAASGGTIDPTGLAGTWINTNKDSRGILRVELTLSDDKLRLHVFGAADPEPHDWGEVPVNDLFAEDTESRRAISFTASYDFGFMETELQANVSKGLLIISCLNSFHDDSGRSDCFSREFFHKRSERG